MKIKRLDCPQFAKKLHSSYYTNLPVSEDAGINRLRNNFHKSRMGKVNSVKPIFHSDGWYLVNGVVWYEYNKEAWQPIDQEFALRTFKNELKCLELGDVNILSVEQSKAIQTLMKTRLATDNQIQMFRSDNYKRLLKKKLLKSKVDALRTGTAP
jgi:hypothetical protein